MRAETAVERAGAAKKKAPREKWYAPMQAALHLPFDRNQLRAPMPPQPSERLRERKLCHVRDAAHKMKFWGRMSLSTPLAIASNYRLTPTSCLKERGFKERLPRPLKREISDETLTADAAEKPRGVDSNS